MPRGRDQAGNIWELDAQGNPVALVQPAPQPVAPGALGVVPPNPAMVAQKAREQQRQDAADVRAQHADQRAAQAAAREQAKFESEDTMAPPPGDTSKTGDEYLATIPPSLAAQVKALSEGRRAFPTGTALRSPAVQQLIAAATQYDPTLDAANAATRVATRKDFTSGKSAQNLTAINTALGHFGTLWQAAQGLENRSIPAWNALANAAESASGDPRVNKFNLARNAVVNELERVFRGTGGSEADIAQWRSTINSAMSPDQLRASIAQGVELLNSRLQALGSQYNQGLGRSSDPINLLNPHSQAVFSALQEGGNGILPDDKGSAPPPPLGPGGGGPKPPGGIPRADYSSMVGGNAIGLASGKTRNVFDPSTAAGISALVSKGRPYEEAAAYAKGQGFDPPDPRDYAAAVAFQKAHPGAKPNVEATRTVAVSPFEQAMSSPVAAGVAGAADAATLGFGDEAAGGVSALLGGDYTQTRDDINARKSILAATHPEANLAGNVIGGVGSAMLGVPAFSRVPGALAITQRLGRFAPLAGDAAYGALYGAGEDNQNRLGGAVTGGLAGMIGGGVARTGTRGLANIVSPPAGAFGPTYAQGVFPTIGQRFGRSGFAGRAINTAEQAMQSFPGLGALVSRARQIPRDQFQVGAFNDALGDINQRLPANMAPGTEPHAFASQAFRDAYSQARQGMQFVPDAQYQADTQALASRITNGVLNPQQAQQVSDVIRNSVTGRLHTTGGVLDGAGYQQAGTELGDAIAAWSKDGTTQPMAAALRDYQTIFDNAARRNSNPAAVQMLDQADKGYAKLVRVQDASARVGGDSGTFTPKAFDRAVQKTAGGVRSGPFLRGDALMQDYADAGRGLTDTLPNSGTADRLLTGQAVAGTGGYALGAPAAIAAHPGSLAPFALYAPGVNSLVTRAIAPRSATLAPDVAATLDRIAAQINNGSALAGRLALPATVGWELQR